MALSLHRWNDAVCLVSLGSSDGVDQEEYSTKGNKWIIDNYPQINFIEKASIGSQCPFLSSVTFLSNEE